MERPSQTFACAHRGDGKGFARRLDQRFGRPLHSRPLVSRCSRPSPFTLGEIIISAIQATSRTPSARAATGNVGG
jgi:hypothetical protein